MCWFIIECCLRLMCTSHAVTCRCNMSEQEVVGAVIGSICTFRVECVGISWGRQSGMWPALSESMQMPQFYRHWVKNHCSHVREVRKSPSLSQIGSTVAAASLHTYIIAQLCRLIVHMITWYARVIMWRLLREGWLSSASRTCLHRWHTWTLCSS